MLSISFWPLAFWSDPVASVSAIWSRFFVSSAYSDHVDVLIILFLDAPYTCSQKVSYGYHPRNVIPRVSKLSIRLQVVFNCSKGEVLTMSFYI